MTPQEAVEKVKKAFPFSGYFTSDASAWTTVGEVVNTHLFKGARLYDFGAGACDKTAVAQVLGCQCTAMDDLKDNWYLQGDNIAKIEAFASDFGIELVNEFGPLPEASYDAAMLNDVLEHIHDSPRDILNILGSGLKEGGYLIVTVPNLGNIRKRVDLMRGRSNLANYDLYWWYEGTWRGPQREYVRSDLEKLCVNLGFEQVELRSVHHMLDNLPRKVRPIYKAVTALFPGWRDSWLLVAKKPKGWTPRTGVSSQEFAEIYKTTSSAELYVTDKSE